MCRFVLAVLIFLLTGCQSIPPRHSVPVEEQAPLFKAPTFLPTSFLLNEVTPTPEYASTQSAACTNLLQYLEDLTYPDFSEVKPGEVIEKQWKVKNGGTCNWDTAYSLQFIGGDQMSAASPQSLVPARNGTETIISLQFTAPSEPGRHSSHWKAFDPNGQPFGDSLYLDIMITE